MKSSDECQYAEWSDPQPLASSANVAIANYPSLVRDSSHLYLFGANLLPTTAALPDSRLWASRIDGNDIGKPDGGDLFIYPKAVALEDGFRLFWGESLRVTGSPRRWFDSRVDRVVTAAYRQGHGWSESDTVLAGDILWDPWLVSEVQRAKRQWVLSFSGRERRDSPRSVHAVIGDATGHYSVVSLPAWGGVASYTASVSTGESVYVVLLGAGPGAPGTNNLLFQHRTSPTADWTHPRAIDGVRALAASEVRLVVDAAGRLQVFWLDEDDGSGLLTRAVSSDRGRSWSVEKPLRFRSGLANLRVLTDECGTVHVVAGMVAGNSSEGATVYAEWREGADVTVQHLFKGLWYSVGAMELDRDGNLILVFLGGAGDPTHQPKMWRATRQVTNNRVTITKGGIP